ncbi:extracellular solute-binding protein [Paucibacter sp. DJ2R-2]|uniref:extracellular solute-binding protein n=1 Tax=Paucibacter sp. DJ2R-2 TaxID=2893558 RepID=UPI0021E3CAEE|nr:extracellular solute-binding protein [Paucibacter sp. DJ2R-2]MCV2419308.1 extracellular solute-binding protein [Paucibacter sp. DJ4R-1]MCV2437788.1 extracellular solute-binding protein [Paucibacter sp. DJ2R-2]
MKRRLLLSALSLPTGQVLAQLAASAPLAPGLPALNVERQLEAAARAEGRLHTLGMPDSWANWAGIWADLKRLYGIEHSDENMNSAEEIERMARDGSRGTVDLGDVGFEYGAVARGRGISRPHKPKHWEQIPAWARDEDGYWALAYTGTIAFAVNKKRHGGRVPRSWQELFDGPYTVQVGGVGSSAQASANVLAAAIALGGDEVRLQPALEAFAKLARQGRLIHSNATVADLQRGKADVFLLWDFVALGHRSRLTQPADYEVLIPTDGSVTSGYTTLINRHAPHPNAAQLAREYIFSDAGQLQLARGYARPIRLAHLDLPPELRQRLLDPAQYSKARALRPFVWAWEMKKLRETWQDEVLKQTVR